MTALTVGPPGTGLREESTLYPREVLNPNLPQSAPRLTLCGRADVMFRGRVARVWSGNILEMLLQRLLSFLAERRLPGNLGDLLSRAGPLQSLSLGSERNRGFGAGLGSLGTRPHFDPFQESKSAL